MDKSKKKRLKERYRIAILNDRTLKEVWYAVLSLRNLIATIGFLGILLIGIGIVLVTFTPLREYVPGYPSASDRRMAIDNYIKIDSIENALYQKDIFIENLHNILTGKNTNPHFVDKDSIKKSNESVHPLKLDSSLYQSIEDDRFNVRYVEDETVLPTMLSTVKMHFYCPLKGEITNHYTPESGHYGIDIVSNANDPVLSVLDGTVISAGWTLEAGYVIIVQHRNNIVSQYKHNSILLKKIGDRVRAGEPLGIIGNTGEYTTGPHLHFELWQNGTPLNPTDYIIF